MTFSSFLTCDAEITDHTKDASGFSPSSKANRFSFSVTQSDKKSYSNFKFKKSIEMVIFHENKL